MTPSSSRRARKLALILLSTMLAAALSACGSPQNIFLNASACSDLVPSSWSEGVQSAPLPDDQSAGSWVAFGNAQTGQLDKANGRTQDVLSIVKSCETRDAAVAKALEPKAWYKFW